MPNSIGKTLGIEIDEAIREDLDQKKTLKLPPTEEQMEKQAAAKVADD